MSGGRGETPGTRLPRALLPLYPGAQGSARALSGDVVLRCLGASLNPLPPPCPRLALSWPSAAQQQQEEGQEEQQETAPSPAMSLVQRKDGTKELVVAALPELQRPLRPWSSVDLENVPSPADRAQDKKKKVKDASEDEMAEVALACHQRRESKWGGYYDFRVSAWFRVPLKILVWILLAASSRHALMGLKGHAWA